MLEDLTVKPRQWPCRVRAILHTLDASDQRILKDAIASPDWTTNALTRALRSKGIDVGYSSIRKHETRQCSCTEGEYA